MNTVKLDGYRVAAHPRISTMMDDNLSVKSSDSATTSGEYEIVPETLTDTTIKQLGTSPTLNIANNGNIEDLKSNLNEVIHELDDRTGTQAKAAGKMDESGEYGVRCCLEWI